MVLAAQYLKDGNYAAAQRIFDRNPNVGLSQSGFDFWGENASLLVENFVKAKRAYEEVASLDLPPILDEAYRMSKLLNQAALATAYALLSVARQPDFFLVDASVGVGGFGIGSSRAIVKGDGMDALTNPIVGAGIGTGGGVFAALVGYGNSKSRVGRI